MTLYGVANVTGLKMSCGARGGHLAQRDFVRLPNPGSGKEKTA